MKKLIASLMTASLVTISASNVVACGNNRFHEIWVVTDGNPINDNSFNQSAFEGANNFLRDILGYNVESFDSVEYTAPTSVAQLTQAYNNAAQRGARTLVLAGFQHASSGGGQHNAPEIMAQVDGSVVLIDNSGDGHENQIGLQFRADISGFMAGVSSIVYSVATNQHAGDTVRLATFGGMSNPGSVDVFMVGYLAAVEYWNNLSASTRGQLLGINETDDSFDAKTAVEAEIVLNNQGDVWEQGWYANSSMGQGWFVGSFGLGQGGTTIANQLLNQGGADVIMPVAGPITQEVLNAIAASNSHARVVGVDVDQVLLPAFSAFNDLFITSAQKDIASATVVAIGHTEQYRDNEEVQRAVAEYWEENLILTHNGEILDPQNSIGDSWESWEGKDIFAGGLIGTAEQNLIVSSGLYEGYLSEHLASLDYALISASMMLFEEVEQFAGTGNETIISYANITRFAEIVLNFTG